MSPHLDEKKQVIVAILDRLRPFCPALGSYVKSIYTIDFDYSVKLSNGRIRLPEELIDDYEMNPSAILEGRFKQAAGRFIPDTPEINISPSPASATVETPSTPPARSFSFGYWRLGVIVFIVLAGYWIYHAAKVAKSDELKNEARVNIYNQLRVEGSTYMVNKLLGGIKGLKVTVTNNSDYLVDIVRVKVTYFKAYGDVYKTETLHFNRLNAHSTQTLDAPDSDRGIKVRIERESFTCAALGIQ